MSQYLEITKKYLEQNNFRVLHAGDDYDMRFAITREGASLDLTDASLWFTVKESSTEEDSEAKLFLIGGDATDASADEIDVIDDTGGVILVKFRGEGAAQKATADLEGKWLCALKVKLGDTDSTKITVARGLIEFLPNLSRTTA